MIAFQVNDMTCGHCVSTITKAVKGADKDAKVEIDLSRHLVQIESGNASAARFSDAIKEAGYTAVEIESASGRPAPGGASKRSGCCCS